MLEQLIASNFPQKGISLAFGYGSRVIKQAGSSNGDLIDVIFIVDNPLEWHRENLTRNESHYSSIKLLPNPEKQITSIQENYGARMYYNAYVTVGNISIKYGIIKTAHLIDDLMNWTDIYIAGRLHKPVEFMNNTCDSNKELRTGLRFNKESAIRASLLQLPESFEPSHLYKTIAGLSYNGDPRMCFGEDENKINNIVSKQMDRFDQLYLPIIKMSPNFKDTVHFVDGRRIFTQDCSPAAIFKNLKELPKNVRRRVCQVYGREARTYECDVVLSSLSRNIDCDKILGRVIASIVRRSSATQSIKGLFTAGLLKSLKYSQRKLAKSFLSRSGVEA